MSAVSLTETLEKYFQHLTRLVLLECNISKNSLVEPPLYPFGNYGWNSLFDVVDALYTWIGINHEKWEILGRRMKLGLWFLMFTYTYLVCIQLHIWGVSWIRIPRSCVQEAVDIYTYIICTYIIVYSGSKCSSIKGIAVKVFILFFFYVFL